MSTEAMSNEADERVEAFDAQEHQSEDGDDSPRETESAILSVVMFGGLLAFAAGCWLLGGFG